MYPDLETFWADLTAAYREEVARLGELGCRYLQLDDTSLAYLNDPEQREHIAQLGGDREHQHEAYIRYLNEAVASRPEGMRITTHMCRGNFRSSWYATGDYEYVAEVLLNELNVDGFFMEWDDERSGGFEPLRFLPPGKVVVLGLVTTKSGELESKDELKRRIEEASRFADIDQLCLSGQCGFSSTVDGNDLSARPAGGQAAPDRRDSPRGLGLRAPWLAAARSAAAPRALRPAARARPRARAARSRRAPSASSTLERLARLARLLDRALDAQAAASQPPRPVGERALGEARRGRERGAEHDR